MHRWIKSLVALLLIPVCIGATNALVRVMRASGNAEAVWVALLAGFACWLVIYLLLPKPTWVYVFGHEVTHVLWTWLFGGRVKRFRATARGGRVVVTKTNFLIALAPYFFPIYAVLILVLFGIGRMIWGWRAGSPYFHLLLGAAYGFHVTLTWHALKREQTDITEHGYFFSAVILWLANVLVLLLALPLVLQQVNFLTVLSWCWTETENVIQTLLRAF